MWSCGTWCSLPFPVSGEFLCSCARTEGKSAFYSAELTNQIGQSVNKMQHFEGVVLRNLCSQFKSRVTSISENEMNIQISLCNVRYVNEMLNISLEIFLNKMHTWETIVILEILNAVM